MQKMRLIEISFLTRIEILQYISMQEKKHLLLNMNCLQNLYRNNFCFRDQFEPTQSCAGIPLQTLCNVHDRPN